MKRLRVATGLAIISLVPVVFLGTPTQAQPPADQLLPAPVRTIIKEVPGPVRTILREVPGPVRTILREVPVRVEVEVPGPVRTVLVPGPVRTVTSPVPGPVRTIVITRTQPPQVVTIPSPVGQPTSAGATVVVETPVPRLTTSPQVIVSASPVPGKTEVRERRVEVSVPQAVGISVGLVALGIALALLALYVVYALGYKDRERVEEKKLSDLNDELFGR